MRNSSDQSSTQVVLITGAAHRVGAAVAEALHAEGFNLVLHYRQSRDAAQTLQAKLNTVRENSVALIEGDLLDTAKLPRLVQQAVDAWGRLDVLINNASSFYPTPMGGVTEAQWDDLLGSNLKAPFFLAQAAAPALATHHGCIVNMADIHAERPLKGYPVYSAAKAGLVMLTKAMARELGPTVRVNAVAPGPVLWPDNLDEETKQHIKSRTVLKRAGHPSDVARAILFLIRDAGYITGQVIAVDGGRSIYS
jgi:pteridine reductase